MSNEFLFQLPGYSADELAALSESQLLELMIKDEDRVPLNVMEECARRGEAMEKSLAVLWDDQENEAASDGSQGRWWLHVHAAMILGKMHSESAGRLLLALMRHIDTEDEQNLFDWLAGYWPILFANKPREMVWQLRELADDLRLSEWMRHQAVEAHVAWFDLQGDPALEEALRWVATCAAAEDDILDFRLLTGSLLLDFPRAEFRPLLEKLVAAQTAHIKHFDMRDVERAYSRTKLPAWRDHWKNPWKFYDSQQIEQRQERWREEDEHRQRRELKNALPYSHDLDDESEYSPQPYVREQPKLGRNDPCHCGSGKKYKKCCLAADEELM